MARANFASRDTVAIKHISVMLGRTRSYDDWIHAFGKAQIALCPRVRHNTLRFVTANRMTLPLLAMVTPYMLGFESKQPMHRIMAAAIEQGFIPCPSDVGPALRLAYENQPDGEVLTVVHRSFCDDIGMVNFALGKSRGRRWLSAVPGNASRCLPTDAVLVFMQGLPFTRRS